MDFANITPAQVQKVEDLLNNRPRKTLGYLSPNKVFNTLTDNILQNCLSNYPTPQATNKVSQKLKHEKVEFVFQEYLVAHLLCYRWVLR